MYADLGWVRPVGRSAHLDEKPATRSDETGAAGCDPDREGRSFILAAVVCGTFLGRVYSFQSPPAPLAKSLLPRASVNCRELASALPNLLLVRLRQKGCFTMRRWLAITEVAKSSLIRHRSSSKRLSQHR